MHGLDASIICFSVYFWREEIEAFVVRMIQEFKK